MKAIELKERVQKSGSGANIADNDLYNALERLEKEIEKKDEREHVKFDKENVLLACGGGVADGYDDMYTAYLEREVCRIREDWPCYENNDALYVMRFTDLCKEIIRNRKPKRFEFRS